MTLLRLRYENGHLIPLDPLPDLQEGQEIQVEWTPQPDRDSIREMLDRTAGLWADQDGIEELFSDSREKWDEEWQQRLSSS